VSRLKSISRTVGTAVLLGQLLIHMGCAGQIASLLEILGAIDRCGQLASRAEARTTGQGQRRQHHRTVRDPASEGPGSARKLMSQMRYLELHVPPRQAA